MQKTLVIFSVFGLISSGYSKRAAEEMDCAPTPPATCYPADCNPCYCLGPNNYGVNAPVRPYTCNGDWVIEIAGLLWNAHQDGMEYAIDNQVFVPETVAPPFDEAEELNTLIDATYEEPNFEWNYGFKLGVGYNTTCDNWDIGVTWTYYRGSAQTHIEAETDDTHTLIALWSAFSSTVSRMVYATDIRTQWKMKLNLIDIELGREHWVSRYLTLRPHIGFRIASIHQDFCLQHHGGTFSHNFTNTTRYNDEVELTSNFKGVGVRAGLDTVWHFQCGFSLYGNFAPSIAYGKFEVDHDESLRVATAPHEKIKVLDTEESLRAARLMLDLALGIQWEGMFCDCQYGLTVMLGWEHHLFFHQNQFFRVMRIPVAFSAVPNSSLENFYHKRKGNLDTQGWTLTVRFAF